MDWNRIDQARRAGGPIEADVIEAYAKGKINRRNFVKRGAIVGLSAPLMSAVIAACGSDDEEGSDAPAETTGSGTDPAGTQAPSGGGTPGGTITAGIQTGDATSGLDPINTLDLGTYCVLSQSFEYLVGLAADGNIGDTGLAASWAPNDDGSVWTFNLREGVMWQDGTPLTSADVAATLDRMVAVNAGVGGVFSEGAVETPDDLTAVINLDSPNGNLPVLLSLFNANSLITPADYSSGTTLDERPAGTGPWIFESFDPSSFRVSFTPNPNWWGGGVTLDGITLQGFESGGTRVAAFAAGEIDAIQQFSVSDGANLLTDSDVTVLKPPSSAHRQLWFNMQIPADNPFVNQAVRQAVCYAINRQQLVDTIYEGEAIIGNDHPVYPTLPFFDDTQEQRPYDPEMARQLLSDAGLADGVQGTLQVGDLNEIPDIAAIIEQNLAEVGISTPVGVSPNSDFYGEYWCTTDLTTETAPCGASAPIGMVDYGHRPTPDIFFGRALQTGGDWNSSNYASDEFDSLFGQYQAAVDVAGQSEAVASIQRLLHEDSPACYPFFFNYLSGVRSNVSDVQVTALGHMYFQNATVS